MHKNELVKQLGQVALKREELKLKINFYQELLEELPGYRSPVYDAAGVRSKKKTDETLNKVLDLSRYEEEIQKLSAELASCIDDFETMICPLEMKQKMVFRLRYLEKLFWEEVAEKMHYSRIQVIRIHNAGIHKLLVLYNKNVS